MSDYIPGGIQVEVLKWLPVKSLLRFRCVCKWWKQLIDSPSFLQEHLAVQKPRFFVQIDTKKLRFLDPLSHCLSDTHRGPIEDEACSLVGTLHGVVCLYRYHIHRNLLLWNPSIRKFSTCPFPLDFKQDVCWVCFGFWIDPSNKEFKIMMLYLDLVADNVRPPEMNCILYSSIRHDWSVISLGEAARIWLPYRHPPLMMGDVAHWVGRYSDQGLVQKAILSFDFRQQRYLAVVEIPHLRYLDSKPPTLHRCQGALSIVCWDHTHPHICDLYSMQQGSWVQMFHINFSPPMTLGLALVRQADASYTTELVLYHTRAAGCIPLTRPSSYLRIAYDFVESLLFPL